LYSTAVSPKIQKLLEPWQRQDDVTLHEADWLLQFFRAVYRGEEQTLDIQLKPINHNPKTTDFIFDKGKWRKLELVEPQFDEPSLYFLCIPFQRDIGYESKNYYVQKGQIQEGYKLLKGHDLLEAFRAYASPLNAPSVFRYNRSPGWNRMSATKTGYAYPEVCKVAILLTAIL
jgi:hypothetical protein